MDLFIVSLRENFWSPGKHESERWSGVFIWFNTLWLLPISKSEYFNEKIQFNSRADWILANLSYIYIDSSYRWKIKRTIIYGTWSMHLNQYAISLSFQRHLSPYINHPAIISLINFYIHSSFNSQIPLTSPDKTRKSVFIPFLYKFISFSYPPIDRSIIPIIIISLFSPFQSNKIPSKKFARKTNPDEFPPSFRYDYLSVPFWKKGVGSPSLFRFHFRKHGSHSRYPLCLPSITIPPSSPLFPFATDLVWRADRFNPVAKSRIVRYRNARACNTALRRLIIHG